jgi:hypothetical protein
MKARLQAVSCLAFGVNVLWRYNPAANKTMLILVYKLFPFIVILVYVGHTRRTSASTIKMKLY